MAEFTKPTNLNGDELLAELKTVGVNVIGLPIVDENEKLVLNIDAKDISKANAVVAGHNGTIVAPEPTVADKLASVGLSIDDLKAALGV